jgi:hypothetical protein
LFYNALRARDEILGFRLIVIDGTNYFLDVGEFRFRESLEGRIAFEELRRDLVNLLVGALRGEHDRDEELILILKVEL